MRMIDGDKLTENAFKNPISYNAFCNLVKRQPTVDAVPVVHGEWQEENRRPRSSMFYCSICHRTAYDIQPTRDKAWKKRCRYAYCPNCGAIMDGKDGDGNE